MLVVKFARKGMQADLAREAAVYHHLRAFSQAVKGSGASTPDWPNCYSLFSGSGFTAIVVDYAGELLHDWSMLDEDEK
jgi:hypothetical protein